MGTPNAAFATLQIIPSAKGFEKHLRREVNAPLTDAGRDIERNLAGRIGNGGRDGGRRLGEHVRKAVDKAGDDSGKSFARRFAERSGRLIFTAVTGTFKSAFKAVQSIAEALMPAVFESVSKGAASAVTNAVTTIGTAASTGTAMTAATGGINLLIAALLALAGAAAVVATGFVALAPIVLVTGGAFGAMFTVATGGAAAFGVLALATHGLGDAFSELSKDGKVSNETLKKLAPSARAFVQEVAKLRKPFGALAKYVQGRVFDKIAKPFRDLAKRWLPVLEPMLGKLAGRFNAFLKTVITGLGKSDFIANIRLAVGAFGDFIERIRLATGPLIDAFGRLARASVPFLGTLGDKIGGLIEKFSAWIAQADKSGKLSTFMKDAAKALSDIWNIGGLVIGIGGELIDIFFPSSKKASDSFLGGVRDTLQRIKDWLADPENKKKIQEFMDKLGDLTKKATTEWIPKVVDFFEKVDHWVSKFEGWAAKVESFKNRVTAVFKALPGAMVSALGDTGRLLFGAGANVVSGFIEGIKSKAGDIIAAVKKYITDKLPWYVRDALGIHSPSRVFMGIGEQVAAGMALGIKRGAGKVTKALDALTAVPDVSVGADVSATGRGRGAAPLIGSLTLTNDGRSLRDQLEEVTWTMRRAARGGVYA
ncbi:hypothetical protein AB0H43_03025 [Hamadaea sp. NPDC050747]|uniref:phage tail protein n=1 Tax=Hamadaea sp. NPDC050747 TaxID=3155789 RepID=UPI0033F1E94C